MGNKELVNLAEKLYGAMHFQLQGIEMTGGELGTVIALAVAQIYKDIEDDNPGASATNGLTIITEEIQGIVQVMEESDEETGHQQTPEGC